MILQKWSPSADDLVVELHVVEVGDLLAFADVFGGDKQMCGSDSGSKCCE